MLQLCPGALGGAGCLSEAVFSRGHGTPVGQDQRRQDAFANFRHPTLIHCTGGPQTLSPWPLRREAPQTLSRLAQCKVPPVLVTVTSPAAPHSPPGVALGFTPDPQGHTVLLPWGPLVPSIRPVARRHQDSPAKVCTKRSGSGVSVIAG